jgi:hypothetical protein
MNMHTMLRNENAIHPYEVLYAQWLKKVSEITGRPVDENGLAHDLFMDGCPPEDAAAELAFDPYEGEDPGAWAGDDIWEHNRDQ